MAKRGKARRTSRYGASEEIHAARAQMSIRRVRTLERQLRSKLRAPADCLHAAHIVHDLGVAEGAFRVNRMDSAGRSKKLLSTDLLVDRFIVACIRRGRRG
jgi:hypothetical protein